MKAGLTPDKKRKYPSGKKKCYSCGGSDHIKKDCPSINEKKLKEEKKEDRVVSIMPSLPPPSSFGEIHPQSTDELKVSFGDLTPKNERRDYRRVENLAGKPVPMMDMEKPAKISPPLPPTKMESVTKTESSSKLITTSRFSSLKINSLTLKSLSEVLKYEFQTPVQNQSLPIILSGKDVLCKAKTGTGKTLAFLIPALEILLNSPTKRNPNDISVLIISPTRELATQISDEATALFHFHAGMKSLTIFGGTNKNTDIRHFKTRIDFLIASPGRLLDHLQTTEGFAKKFNALKILIFDEADQLLDMGFLKDIEKILRYLPLKETRQTLLFSATVPPNIETFSKTFLREGRAFIDTVGKEAVQTHEHVTQELISTDLHNFIPTILSVIEREMIKNDDYKIIVFFTTARLTGFMAEIFQEMGLYVLEMHSRKSQSVRTRTAEEFKNAKKVILFSSDVSARGMDYPDITFVLQCGLTVREQYIHRLGRTARAGKKGDGLLLIQPFEENFMRRELKDFVMETIKLDTTESAKNVSKVLARVQGNEKLRTSAEQAYQAYLGFYNSYAKKIGWSSARLVEESNEFSRCIGLKEIPFLLKKTVGKMGLKGVPGLRVH